LDKFIRSANLVAAVDFQSFPVPAMKIKLALFLLKTDDDDDDFFIL
jgi:hypothetical protein